MADDEYTEFAKLVALEERGSVVAAAGCGKTEQIALATKYASGRRLILTHTHAGVDALRARLKKHGVPPSQYRLDTIAGWCLRYAASYPVRSGLKCVEPQSSDEWHAVYNAAVLLQRSQAVKGVLAASYSGLFVDEYQDCNSAQHAVLAALAEQLPVCVFGDRLQAIFDFKGQAPVDWDEQVFPTFKQIGTLEEPWRWRKADNDELANWLINTRKSLEAGGPIDLNKSPDCVNWVQLPDAPQYAQAKIIGTCQTAIGQAGDETLVVIGDAANINARAALAQKLSAQGFTTIEPIDCKQLFKAANDLDATDGNERLGVLMGFIANCMTGADRAEFLASIASHQSGKKQGGKKFGDVIPCGMAITEGAGDDALLALLEGFQQREATRPYRREMLGAMCSALRIRMRRKSGSLIDAVWDVQNRLRHSGRRIAKRSIGSTLLVKGLEFEHAVVVHTPNMTAKDWYVAITRASKRLTIVSPTQSIQPGK